jgi:hypothetical protein
MERRGKIARQQRDRERMCVREAEHCRERKIASAITIRPLENKHVR